MIRKSRAGFLFRSTEKIMKDNPDLPAFETYDDLYEAIRQIVR
jgi:phosphoserine/homoserine phosphotransferase